MDDDGPSFGLLNLIAIANRNARIKDRLFGFFVLVSVSLLVAAGVLATTATLEEKPIIATLSIIALSIQVLRILIDKFVMTKSFWGLIVKAILIVVTYFVAPLIAKQIMNEVTTDLATIISLISAGAISCIL